MAKNRKSMNDSIVSPCSTQPSFMRFIKNEYKPNSTVVNTSTQNFYNPYLMNFEWTDLDIDAMSGAKPRALRNFVSGEWKSAAKSIPIVDPMNGEEFIQMPATSLEEGQEFIDNLNSCPKSGLHNVLKNPERFNMWGQVTANLCREFAKKEVMHFFTRAIQRVAPKDYGQSYGEVKVTANFLNNFCGDQVRFLARGFQVSGDHMGQTSQGMRWPYGPVVLVAPFNFPLEIPVLQLMGALYMGNRVLLKCASMTSLVMEEFVKLLHFCGAPKDCVELIHCGGSTMGKIIAKAQPRLLQFTGSSTVAEELCTIVNGRIKIEDAGFDWKILGPDATDVPFKAWNADQDSFNFSGQKCSAQSILFMHQAYDETDFLARYKAHAAARTVDNLTVGPVLSHTNKDIAAHQARLLEIPGAKVAFGGKPITGTKVPACYGMYEPTLIEVPITEAVKPEHFPAVTTEIFGPFCVLIRYTPAQLPMVLYMCETMTAHLTAAVVSNDMTFTQHVLGNTVNGTTYAGARARTTGTYPLTHFYERRPSKPPLRARW